MQELTGAATQESTRYGVVRIAAQACDFPFSTVAIKPQPSGQSRLQAVFFCTVAMEVVRFGLPFFSV